MRGFTDALRMELESAGSGVSCTTVHPGGIRTNIARNARIDPSVLPDGSDRTDHSAEFDKIARTTPEKAAEKILDAVQHDRRRVTIGPDGVLIDLLSRLPAGLYQRILVRAAARRTS